MRSTIVLDLEYEFAEIVSLINNIITKVKYQTK